MRYRVHLAVGLTARICLKLTRGYLDAVFSFPEAQYGVPPIFGSSQRLYKTIGMGRAKELLFTGRTVDAPLTRSESA